MCAKRVFYVFSHGNTMVTPIVKRSRKHGDTMVIVWGYYGDTMAILSSTTVWICR